MNPRLQDLYELETCLCEVEFDTDNEFHRKAAQIERAIIHSRIDQILMKRRVQVSFHRSGKSHTKH